MPQVFTPATLHALEERLGPARVRTSQSDRRVMAHDASHFLRIPAAVVTAHGPQDVQEILSAIQELGLHLTFRSGGTSLSGQGTSTGVLLDTRQGFRDIEVLDQGKRVRVQPGATVRAINNRLRRFKTKLGPDPASEIACTIGGVIANNSSGMSCGTEANSYQTVESLEFILPSGTRINSASADAQEELARLEPELCSTLMNLRDQILASSQAHMTIESMFTMKNTMGYGLNALIDYDNPLDILVHLLVGSEGTLAFITQAVFKTVPIHPHVMTGLLIYDSLFGAARAIPYLVAAGASAVEIMDATSLKVAQRSAEPLDQIADLSVQDHAALLIEFEGPDENTLRRIVGELNEDLKSSHLVSPVVFTSDSVTRTALWKLRKGLYTLVAGARPPGTTALLEDVVVPVAALAPTCVALEELFEHFGYQDAVIFGHAKDGNIHFMLTDTFDNSDAIKRFAKFTDRLVDLILAAGGSLKAEHGTGLVMAPFVERQYGAVLYQIMKDIKLAFDPKGILNPGVIITADSKAHLTHFKPVVAVKEAVDSCVECGYCEPVCPSKDLTLTPRQRIVLSREIEQARVDNDSQLVKSMQKQFDYTVVNTCAVDGMCQTACPLDINTGDLVRTLREERAPRVISWAWLQGAKRWSTFTAIGGSALNMIHTWPQQITRGPNRFFRKVFGSELVPLRTADLPAGGIRRSLANMVPLAPHLPSSSATQRVNAVYFPSCQGALFRSAEPGPDIRASLEYLSSLSQVDLIIPEQIDGLCCGTPWRSKGMSSGLAVMNEKVLAALSPFHESNTLIVTDMSSCAEGLHTLLSSQGFTIQDPVEFISTTLLGRLPDLADKPVESLTVHPTCSTERLNTTQSLLAIARHVAKQVEVPSDWGCCGYAGDRGMLHPELTASATLKQAAQIKALNSQVHASSNRACEIAMTRATGFEYQSIVQLLATAYGLN